MLSPKIREEALEREIAGLPGGNLPQGKSRDLIAKYVGPRETGRTLRGAPGSSTGRGVEAEVVARGDESHQTVLYGVVLSLVGPSTSC